MIVLKVGQFYLIPKVMARFNQTLLNLLGTLEKHKQENWFEYLPELVKTYNTTVHASPDFTPHYVRFGTHVRLPVGLV